MKDIQSVGVIGSGLMGAGIGQVAATAGLETVLVDRDPAALDRARKEVARSLDRMVAKGTLPEHTREGALARLRYHTSPDDAAACDLVIEAVPEDPTIKRAVFAELDRLAPADTIFATNTSSLTVASLASGTSRPDRFLGLHFFNPVPVMGLVEVVRTALVREEVVAAGMDFVRRLGKEPVLARDTGGFIVNRLLIPYMMDAIRALESGVATVADIDTAMRLGAGHPMGPFTLLDLVGLDTTARAGNALRDEFGDPRFGAPDLLQRLVDAGHLGRKSGRGFYVHGEGDPKPVQEFP